MARKSKILRPSKVLISPILIDTMIAATLDVYPKEAYGWLLGRRDGKIIHVTSVLPIVTVKRTKNSVTFDSETSKRLDFLSAHKVGEFHSHPDWTGLPSETDLKSMKNPVEYIVEAWMRSAGSSNGKGKLKKGQVGWHIHVKPFNVDGAEIPEELLTDP